MELQIPNKRPSYIIPPSPEVLGIYLEVRRPAMPEKIRTIAISAWLRAVEKGGGRHKDGTLLTEWAPFFLGYANAIWRNDRLR